MSPVVLQTSAPPNQQIKITVFFQFQDSAIINSVGLILKLKIHYGKISN